MSDEERRAAFARRLFEAALGTFDLYGVYLGDRLGYYGTLAGTEGMTAAELAAGTSTDERYVREWLEQQATTGILEVDAAAPADARRFRLPDAHAGVLTDHDALDYMAPMVRQLVAAGRALDQVVDAFGTGGGVSWSAYGSDMVEGLAEGNRAMFLNLLATDWFPTIPELDRRLSADPPVRVADIGCGTGWSSIAIARAYPNVTVDGFDADERSVDLARRNAGAAGLSDRLTFDVRDAADPTLRGEYDVISAFETIHDMARPTDALRTMRRLAAPGGFLLVVDEAVEEQLRAPGSDVDRLNYGFSITTCLPAARTETPSEAIGTVMRPSMLRAMASAAGFSGVEILPVEHDLWRFYRLIP